MATRKLSYREAINEALAQEMERDQSVIVMGEEGGLPLEVVPVLVQFFARIGPVDVALCVGDVPVHRHVEAIDEFAHADQTAPEGKTHRDATRDIVKSLWMGERQAASVVVDESTG